METTNPPSNLFSLNWRDAVQAFILAVGTPLLYWVQEAIPGWNIPPAAKVALSAAVMYLIKNFFRDDTKVAQKIADENGAKIVPKSAKVVSVILVLLGLSISGFSQSNLFTPLTKRKSAHTLIAGVTAEPTFWALRPAVIAATIFIDGAVEAAGGTGIAYQNITQKGTDMRSYVNYDIGAYVLVGGSVIGDKSDIEKVAIVGSALNGMIGLGLAYSHQKDPVTQIKKWKPGIALIWKINFNN